jgi:2-keto-4-pentenoate hydratase
MSETLKDPRIADGMRAQMELRQKAARWRRQTIGWKVGLGAPAMQAKCNLTAPIVGFLLDRAQLASGAEVSLAGWHKPVAEAEIAAYIGRDLPAGADRDDVRKAIAALGPAIELADPTRRWTTCRPRSPAASSSAM